MGTYPPALALPQVFARRGTDMVRKNLWLTALTAMFTLAVVCGVMRGDDAKPSDEGKAADFKGKAFDINGMGRSPCSYHSEAGKGVTATTKVTRKGKQTCTCSPTRKTKKRRGGQGCQPRPQARGEIHTLD